MNFENPAAFRKNKEEGSVHDKETVEPSLEKQEAEEAPEDISENFYRKIKEGEDVAKALRNISEEALNNGVYQRSMAWDQARNLLVGMKSFDYLMDVSDDEVKKVYVKYFEPQTSKYYLGGLLASLDRLAESAGFLNVRNNKVETGADDNIKKSIAIIERLVKISRKENK